MGKLTFRKSAFRMGGVLVVASLAVLASFVATPESAVAAVQYTLFASPSGGGAACTQSSPCSLVGARDKVRTLNSNMTGDIVVNLVDGTYQLGATFELVQSATVRDSGTNGFSVVYQAAEGAKPILSGGQTISGWTQFDSVNNIFRANVGTSLDTRQLYVDGTRAVRARGEALDAGLFTRTASGFTAPATGAYSGMSTWGNKTNIELVGARLWKLFRCPVASISGLNITMANPCWNNSQLHPASFDTVSWVENAYELLDTEGEWYLNRSTGYLYYKPLSGQDMSSVKVVAPKLETLLSVTGTLDTPIQSIQFKGIAFSDATWLRPNSAEGYPVLQSGFLFQGNAVIADQVNNLYKVPGNVVLSAAKSVTFERNTFERLGGVALSIESGSQSNTVIGNLFRDISGSGVTIGHMNDHHPSDSRSILKDNVVANNYITRIGEEYYDGVGILGAYTENTLIAHNEIVDVPYTPISFGWGWGATDPGGSEGYTTPTPAKNNKIQFNNLHNYMTKLKDGGGVYTLGAQPGSVIANNYVHGGYLAPGNNKGSIYLDEATQFYNVTNNVLGEAPAWIHLWTPTIKNNTVRYNYTDTTDAWLKAPDNDISNNELGLASWPTAAQAIIAQAGIEASYRDIMPVAMTNYALNKSATASSVYSPSFTPDKAADGLVGPANGWSPAGAPELSTWTIDLGVARILSAIELVARPGYDNPETRRNFEVRGSNSADMSGYVVLGGVGATPFVGVTPFGAAETWRKELNLQTRYRYLQVAKTVSESFYIAEFRAFGAPDPNYAFTPRIAGPWTTLFSPTQPAPANYMNDHTVIKGADGKWHVIGISGNGNGYENSFASASMTSLTSGTWTEGPVLAQYFDGDQPLNAWAPHTISVGGTTYLFYRSNRAGVANNTSGGSTVEVDSTTDPTLASWTRRSDITVSGLTDAFRDPMVFPYNGGYVMYATAIENGANFLASYTSTNLLNWTYAGRALTLSGSATTAPWSTVESPFVFKYGSFYYLSTTITDSSPATYHDTFIFRSANPMDFGDFNGVSSTGAGTLVTKLPVHAPEYVQDTNGQWYITTAGWQNQSLYSEAAHGVAIAPLAFTNDAHAIPSSNQVLAYKFDDQSTATDSSGNNRAGVLTGDATFVTGGHTGGGLTSSSGAVTIPAQSYASDFTVAGWIKTASTPSNSNGIVSGAGQDVNLYQGYPRLYAGTDIATSSVAVVANTWTHLAATRSGTLVTIFINGVASGTGNWSGVFSPKFAGRALSAPASQTIDDFVMDNRALALNEILQLAQSTPTMPSGLDVQYLFAAPPIATVGDSSGQGRDGTASGNFAWSLYGQFGRSMTANSGGVGTIALPALSIAGDFSVSAWVKPTSGLTNTSGILKGSGMDINFYAGRPRLYATSDRVVASKSIPIGAWTHVVITRSSGSLKLYLDGVLDAQGTWSGTFAPTTVGGSLAGSNTIGLDDLLIYDRALTDTEVANLG